MANINGKVNFLVIQIKLGNTTKDDIKTALGETSEIYQAVLNEMNK